MLEVTIGIDVGTSYTKAALRSSAGQIVRVSRTRSPVLHDSANIETYRWWKCVHTVLQSVIADGYGQNPLSIRGICISAIAPTLTVFDRVDCRRAYSILYSSLPADGSLSWSQCDQQLTLLRIRTLEEIAERAGFVSPAITDLVGYLNWCLTNELTINAISLVEMGMTAGSEDSRTLAIGGFEPPTLVRVIEPVGKTNASISAEIGLRDGVPVCGGCPDTLASAMGAGLCDASERMLYLGTFGSFMSLEVNINRLLDMTSCSALPFSWMLSVPGFGPKIESLSEEWINSNSSDHLNRFDAFAAETSPGAEGTLFLVPRWKNGMSTVGAFEFIPGNDGNIGGIGRRARAVLESLGYAILSLAGQQPNTIKVSGGGARSTTWLDSVSAAMGVDIEAQAMCWESAGTADIAARMIWGESVTRECYRTSGSTKSFAMIRDNCERARTLYGSEGWI